MRKHIIWTPEAAQVTMVTNLVSICSSILIHLKFDLFSLDLALKVDQH